LRRVGLGYGLIATVLIPVALLLFKVLRFDQAVSAMLLLSGVWAFVFGLLMEKKEERLYYSGFGVIVAILSAFVFISLRYTVGLVIVAIVVLALTQAVFRPGSKALPTKA